MPRTMLPSPYCMKTYKAKRHNLHGIWQCSFATFHSIVRGKEFGNKINKPNHGKNLNSKIQIQISIKQQIIMMLKYILCN